MRRSFNLLVVLSTLILIVLVAIDVRSFVVQEAFTRDIDDGDGHTWEAGMIAWYRGTLHFGFGTYEPAPGSSPAMSRVIGTHWNRRILNPTTWLEFTPLFAETGRTA